MTRSVLLGTVLAAGLFAGPSAAACAGQPQAPVPTGESTPDAAVAVDLHPAAAAYVAAVEARDVEALAAAFAPDGEVIDVSRRIVGRDAVREWAAREVVGGSLRVDTVTPLGPHVQRVRVHWAPSGSAGWAADYTFTVVADEIAEADLQYAR
jgi:hypothetical protein